MKTTLRLEEAGILFLAVFFNTYLPYAWWWYWVFFLAPDISMVGYVINSRAGAFLYNLFHHKGVAILLYCAGLMIGLEALQFAGLLMLGHSAFDRVLGYGLKYSDSFHHTHLGMIGPATRR